MPFITTAAPPLVTPDLAIEADAWWPALNLADLRATCRLDGTVTPARLRAATRAAIASIAAELAPWRATQEAAGHTRLADIPGAHIDGESTQVHQWRRAIYACVQAQLAEAYRDISTIPQGAGKEERIAAQLALKVDEHRRAMRWAISDLTGRPRTTVELI